MKKIKIWFSNKSKSEKIEFITILTTIIISGILILLDYCDLFNIDIKGYLTITVVLLSLVIGLNLSEKHDTMNKFLKVFSNGSNLYTIRPRNAQTQEVPFEDCWRDAKEIDIISIANTAFLKGQGLDRLRKATQSGVSFKIISLDPDDILCEKYISSKILSPISMPLHENISGYKEYTRNYPDMTKYVTVKTADYIIPYSMMIVKDRNNSVSSIKVDIYSVNTDIQDRRCFFVDMNDKKNVDFYLKQWDYLWETARNV